MSSATPQSASHTDSLLQLKGVGPRVVEKLAKIGLHSIQDVLFNLPYRYEDRSRIVPIGALRQGQSALIEGVINYTDTGFTRSGKRRRMLLLHLSDGTGSILLRFFYFNKQQQQTLQAGARIRCFGNVRFGASSLEIVHPEYSLLTDSAAAEVEACLTPVYHTTDGISQTLLRRLSGQCLALLKQDLLDDYLPPALCAKTLGYSLSDAIRYVHRPPVDADLNQLLEGAHPAQARLVFEELLAHHLSLQTLRVTARQQPAAKLQTDNHLLYRFIKSLPFELTRAQQKVNQAILHDLESGVP